MEHPGILESTQFTKSLLCLPSLVGNCCLQLTWALFCLKLQHLCLQCADELGVPMGWDGHCCQMSWVVTWVPSLHLKHLSLNVVFARGKCSSRVWVLWVYPLFFHMSKYWSIQPAPLFYILLDYAVEVTTIAAQSGRPRSPTSPPAWCLNAGESCSSCCEDDKAWQGAGGWLEAGTSLLSHCELLGHPNQHLKQDDCQCHIWPPVLLESLHVRSWTVLSQAESVVVNC